MENRILNFVFVTSANHRYKRIFLSQLIKVKITNEICQNDLNEHDELDLSHITLIVLVNVMLSKDRQRSIRYDILN